MAIPKNITREHLLKAISKIDTEGIPKDGDSQYYDVVYNGKKYPPKVIVSYANIFANGNEINRNSFKGGLDTECFVLLQNNGFEIINKTEMSYYTELIKFLAQAKTNDLGTTRNNYLSNYMGLDIDISFGQGGLAKIPWISFLGNGQTTRNGIYPVYLYFKAENLLFLAYGISVTNKPNKNWNLKSPKTISDYFKENDLGNPFKYGDSLVFKIYDTNKLPASKTIDDDLYEILSYYKSIDFNEYIELSPKQIEFELNSFQDKLADAGLIFTIQLIQRFIASLCTKPFVICSGLSGSGKTKLAQAFVQWICESDKQYKIIPVGADWTNREPLLGYPNGLDPKSYVAPDSGALQLILEASKKENQSKPYFMILDEMNLSHVERYFADFLSIMESGDSIKLYSGTDRVDSGGNKIEQEIIWPKNVFIIGTVNIDETTYMFSPKVLDRANVIEFRITPDEMVKFFEEREDLNMEALFLDNNKSKGGAGQSMGESFFKLAEEKTITRIPEIEGKDNVLNEFFKQLQIVGSEFGYRSATEIELLITKLGIDGLAFKDGESMSNNTKIDIAIMQKLLPKLHGSRNKLTKVLPILGGFCLTDNSKIKEDYLDKFLSNSLTEVELKADTNIKYKISFEKICRMYKNAVENGFASYAEA
jgi:5-methylcytosine-specific restriction protein B